MLDITVVITNSDGIEDIKGSTQICVGVYSISPIRKHNDIQETVCDMLAAASGLIIGQKEFNIPMVIVKGYECQFNNSRLSDAYKLDT